MNRLPLILGSLMLLGLGIVSFGIHNDLQGWRTYCVGAIILMALALAIKRKDNQRKDNL